LERHGGFIGRSLDHADWVVEKLLCPEHRNDATPLYVAGYGRNNAAGRDEALLWTRPLVSACGLSDIAGPGPTVRPDGELTADNIIVFIGWFVIGDLRADIARSGQLPTPDGKLTADDVILFVQRLTAGC